MDTRDLLNLRRMALSGATRKPAISAFLDADARTGQAPQQTVQQTPGSVVENARQRALMALGASPKPSMGVPQAKLVTPTTAASGLRSMLPQRGTPGSAALGAFGQTMSQLGGYQDKPMTFGQILGASLGEARKAYGTAEERQRQIAAEKAAVLAAAEEKEYQRQQDIKKYRLDVRKAEAAESKAKTASRSEADKHYADAERMGLTGSMADEYVLSQLRKTKTTKPSGFVSVYDKEGNFVENVREDSEKADNYAQEGYRIVESTSITGTKEEVGFGLSKTDYSKRVLKAFDATESINKLENVKSSFDENFLRIGGKVDLAIAKGADWGNFATDKQKDLIGRVSDWQLDAWTQVNETIKAITGAQMSEPEAKRIMKQLPDPREADFFKISSPTQYKAKLERALQEAKLAVARQQYFLKNGLEPIFKEAKRTEENPRGYNVFYETDDGVLTLDGTKILMKKEVSRLAEKYKDLPNEEKRAAIKSDMQSLFGLGV